MSNRAVWVIGKNKLTEGTSIHSQRLTYISHITLPMLSMCQAAIFWFHWFLFIFSIFFFYWHMLCSLSIIDLLCVCLSEALHLKFSIWLTLSCSLFIFEPIAHTCTTQLFPIFPESDMKLKYEYDSMDKRASEQMNSPASKPFPTHFSYLVL